MTIYDGARGKDLDTRKLDRESTGNINVKQILLQI